MPADSSPSVQVLVAVGPIDPPRIGHCWQAPSRRAWLCGWRPHMRGHLPTHIGQRALRIPPPCGTSTRTRDATGARLHDDCRWPRRSEGCGWYCQGACRTCAAGRVRAMQLHPYVLPCKCSRLGASRPRALDHAQRPARGRPELPAAEHCCPLSRTSLGQAEKRRHSRPRQHLVCAASWRAR